MFQLNVIHCCRFSWRVVVCRRVFLRAPCCFGCNDSAVMHWPEPSCSFIGIVPRASSACSLPIYFLGASFLPLRFRITKQFYHGGRMRDNRGVWMLQLSSQLKVQRSISIQTIGEAKSRSNQGFRLCEDMSNKTCFLLDNYPVGTEWKSDWCQTAMRVELFKQEEQREEEQIIIKSRQPHYP